MRTTKEVYRQKRRDAAHEFLVSRCNTNVTDVLKVVVVTRPAFAEIARSFIVALKGCKDASLEEAAWEDRCF